MNNTLHEEIRATLNRHSAENGSGTPDHVLADYLLDCLAAFDTATRHRDDWWGVEHEIGGGVPARDERRVEA